MTAKKTPARRSTVARDLRALAADCRTLVRRADRLAARVTADAVPGNRPLVRRVLAQLAAAALDVAQDVPFLVSGAGRPTRKAV